MERTKLFISNRTLRRFFFFRTRHISLRKKLIFMLHAKLCTCVMALVSERFLRTFAILETANRFSLRE